MKRLWTGRDPYVTPLAGFQLAFRAVLLAAAVAGFVAVGSLTGQLLLVVAVVFPTIQKKKRITSNCAETTNETKPSDSLR